MKALVVFDSFFGNTAQVAQAIANAIGPAGEVGLFHVSKTNAGMLKGLKLLIVGSPTRGFMPSPDISAFLNNMPEGGLKGVRIGAFDTRIALEDIKPTFLRFIVKAGGYAAPVISKKLVQKGGEQVLSPEGFFVQGKEGPLRDKELERAHSWAKQIMLAPFAKQAVNI